MAIGNMWNTSNPKRIWAWFDPDDDVKIPIGIEERLTDMGVGYASHDVVVASPLECPDEGSFVPGSRVRVRIKRAAAAAYDTAVYYPVLMRVSGDDGTSRSDITLYLRFRDGLSNPQAET